MNIYAYTEKKTLVNKLRVDNSEAVPTILSYIKGEEEQSLREFISEELFNQGLRRESASVSFVITSIEGGKKGQKQ